MARAFSPPGWPPEVRPPDAPDWQQTAISWLLDVAPPEARSYVGLRREPVVLAAWVRWHNRACLEAVRRGLSEARSDLRDYLTDVTIERAVGMWLREEARLLVRAREVALVEEALRGVRLRPRL